MTLDPSFFEVSEDSERTETEQAEACVRRLVGAQEAGHEATPLLLINDAGCTVFRCRRA